MADSFTRVPPDSTGKRINTSQDTVGGVAVETQRMVIAGGGIGQIEQYAQVDEVGALSVTFAQGQPNLDAFGSLIVSTAKPLMNFEFVQDESPESLQKTEINNGTAVRNAQSALMTLTCTTADTDEADLTSNKILKYIPGTGNRMETTLRVGDTGKVNNFRRWGLFDDNNGVFFEVSDTGLSFVVRSNTSGSPVDSKLAQAAWEDPLDGTGRSGVTLDITKVNIWWIDYQWLGAGAVRFGIFNPNGQRIVAGQVENANALNVPYMRTGSLRAKYQNINTGVTGSTSEMFVVCGSVRRDGNVDPKRAYFGDIDNSAVGVSGSDVYALAVRPKSTAPEAVVAPENIQIYTDQPLKVEIYENPTLTAPTWAVTSLGPMEADDAASAISGGVLRASYYVSAGATEIDLETFFSEALQTINILPDGSQPVFAVTLSQLSAVAAAAVSFNYSEIG